VKKVYRLTSSKISSALLRRRSSNALRHAEPTVIGVSLRTDLPNLVLEIKDNGSGIARNRLTSEEGFGLANMRERAKNLGAELSIDSAADRGTGIVVRLPINS
jgi:signal transduction histidine kinase